MTESARTVDYETSRRYWSADVSAGERAGVADIGGCGLTEVRYRHHEEVEHLTRIVPLDTTMSVLELGCGNGRWIVSLAPRVAAYVAVDFSAQMLALARGRVREAGLSNVIVHESAVEHYEPAQDFDMIYLSGVSQYLHDADLQQLLRRSIPRLKPGGVIVDRSTVHRHRRTTSNQPEYFCIYRTTADVEELYARAGLSKRYAAESYQFLNVPNVMRSFLVREATARFAVGFAPVSWSVLRSLASVSSRFFGRRGEVLDYSHDFFVFERAR